MVWYIVDVPPHPAIEPQAADERQYKQLYTCIYTYIYIYLERDRAMPAGWSRVVQTSPTRRPSVANDSQNTSSTSCPNSSKHRPNVVQRSSNSCPNLSTLVQLVSNCCPTSSKLVQLLSNVVQTRPTFLLSKTHQLSTTNTENTLSKR